jgi:hypothetical protein
VTAAYLCEAYSGADATSCNELSQKESTLDAPGVASPAARPFRVNSSSCMQQRDVDLLYADLVIGLKPGESSLPGS